MRTIMRPPAIIRRRVRCRQNPPAGAVSRQIPATGFRRERGWEVAAATVARRWRLCAVVVAARGGSFLVIPLPPAYAPAMLAAVDFDSPLLWALFIGWILSVVLHEFAHGLVAYWGGDYTIRERGGLTLNPLQYIDPVMSILLPIVIFLIGGIPLPGGVTYIRNDLLRSRRWESAVAAAGPAMNFLLFLALVIPFHPKIGWVDVPAPGAASNAMIFLGGMAVLQMLAVFFNLLPVPPLDGFGIIAPYMNPETRLKMMTPPLSHVL